MEQIKVIKSVRPSIIQAIIFIVLGVSLIVWSYQVLNFIVELIGASVVLLSVISIVRYYQVKRGLEDAKLMPPIDSYISLIFGILLMTFPKFFMSILMIIIGLTSVLGAILQFYSFYQIKKMGTSVKSYAYISPSLMILIGACIIANPWGFANGLLVLFFGVASIIYGITNVVKYFVCK